MKWFRCYTDILSDDRLGLLAFEDRWHFIAVLAMKASGLLDEDISDLRDRRIARNLGLTLVEAENVKKRLGDVGLISTDWQPTAWDRRQYAHDTSAERTRQWRERKKQANPSPERHGDVTVTDTDTDTDTDKTLPNGSVRGSRDRVPPAPYAEILDLYHSILTQCPRVAALNAGRKQAIQARWRNELPTLDNWRNYFESVALSEFLTGRVSGRNGSPPFVADIDFLIRPSTVVKVAEGKYHRGIA